MKEIEPFYQKGVGRGRPAMGVERMLRMYIAQQCFGFSDEGTDDALYDSQSIRRFVGTDLSRESAPDATTLLRFCRLLETHQLTQRIFDTINDHLADIVQIIERLGDRPSLVLQEGRAFSPPGGRLAPEEDMVLCTSARPFRRCWIDRRLHGH